MQVPPSSSTQYVEMLSEEDLLQSLNAPYHPSSNNVPSSTSPTSSNFVQSPLASLLQANPFLLAQQQQQAQQMFIHPSQLSPLSPFSLAQQQQQQFPLHTPPVHTKKYIYTITQLLQLRDHPISRTMPTEISNLEIAITNYSADKINNRREKLGISTSSTLSSSPSSSSSSYLSNHPRSRGNSGANSRGIDVLSSPSRRSGLGSDRSTSKKSHFFNQSSTDSSTAPNNSSSSTSSFIRERGRRSSSATTNGGLDNAPPTRPAPKQAAWFNEKITKAGDSLEPNPDELTQTERERRNAFEEFRKQHTKNREEESAFGGQHDSDLPSFFSDAPSSNMMAGSDVALSSLEDDDTFGALAGSGGDDDETNLEGDGESSLNLPPIGAMSRFASLMQQSQPRSKQSSLTSDFMDLHLGPSDDDDLITDEVDSIVDRGSSFKARSEISGGSKFFSSSTPTTATQVINIGEPDRAINADIEVQADSSATFDQPSQQQRASGGGSRFIPPTVVVPRATPYEAEQQQQQPQPQPSQAMKEFALSPMPPVIPPQHHVEMFGGRPPMPMSHHHLPGSFPFPPPAEHVMNLGNGPISGARPGPVIMNSSGDMMDASRLENELMGGNRPTRDSPPVAHNIDALQNVFAQMQQPSSIGAANTGAPMMPGGRMLPPPQHLPPQMPGQMMGAPFMNGLVSQQQFINPYQQYVEAQAMKKNQMQPQPQQPKSAPSTATTTTAAEKTTTDKQVSPQQEQQQGTPSKTKTTVKQNRSQFVPSQISKSIGKAIKPKKTATPSPSSNVAPTTTSSTSTPSPSSASTTPTQVPQQQPVIITNNNTSHPPSGPTQPTPLNVQMPHPQMMNQPPMFLQRGMMVPPHPMAKIPGGMPPQAQQFGPRSPSFMMPQPNFMPPQFGGSPHPHPPHGGPPQGMQQWFPAAFMGQAPMPGMVSMGNPHMSGEVLSLEDLEKNLTHSNK